MDARIYPIRRELSLVLALVEESKRAPDPTVLVTALDALQDVLSRTLDLVEELEEKTHHPRGYVRRDGFVEPVETLPPRRTSR